MFGNSPDETAYCRLVLNRETVPDALVMIQPTLLAYSLDAPPTPVRAGLDSSGLRWSYSSPCCCHIRLGVLPSALRTQTT